jgi:serine protease Do
MNKNFAAVVLAAALGGSAVTYHVTHEAAPQYVFAQERGVPGMTFAPMLKKVVPSVVNVTSEVRRQPTNLRNRQRGQGQLPPGLEDFFRGFGGGVPDFDMPDRRRGGGVGSGVIVSNDGYVLTNNHVVEGADKVTVSLQDRREFTAKVVGTDPLTDVAVLKVDGATLPALPISDSAKVQVGDVALAIGNPFGLSQTVTMGIVGATGRTPGAHPGNYEDFIQTDAAINPGNSGGALVNASGQLIGINTMIISGSGGNQGIGFAIPVNMAREVMDQLVKSGKVVRGFLGAGIQPVTPELQRAFNLKSPNGAVIREIRPGQAAEKAGLKVGDVVTAVNGEPVVDDQAFRLRISRGAPGSTVKLTVHRPDGTKEIPVVLGTLKPETPEGEEGPREFGPGERSPLEGVSVDELTPQISQQLELPSDTRGVVVTDVSPDSSAAEKGLRRGDVIQQVNRRDVATVREFEAAVRSNAKSILMLVNRRGVTQFVVIEPSSR